MANLLTMFLGLGWAKPLPHRAWLPPTIRLLTVAVAATVVAGCADDCADAAEAIEDFVTDRARRTCKVDDDCAAVAVDHCIPCGRIAINQSAAESTLWAELNEEAATACDNECALCDSFVSPPRCTDGVCN
jgi:hypothetical protein